jgi:hypothetical protein
MAQKWEYKYVDLYRGEFQASYSPADTSLSDAFGGFEQEVAALGQEGWEAVGEIVVTFKKSNNTNTTRLAQLLMKRPI